MSETTVQIETKAGAIRTSLSGYDLLLHPRLNKGTAFTETERDAFSLHGLLPPHIGALKDQSARRLKVFANLTTAFERYSFMRDLQDTNETLFYSLIAHDVETFLPVVYTPSVGEGCQRFSEIWRKPRGLFISYPNKGRIEQILSDTRYDEIRCIVVSDGERILGLGDQGAGGMGIPIGKMALYTGLAGVPPEHCLPILLDVGTDNEERLNDPIYIGWRQKRVRGQEYDDFVDAFVSAVKRRWPQILLQWEDFAGQNAARFLEKYRNQLCTFNDDIQGTAAVATATILGAVRATGIPLRDQKIGVFGFGTAGIGISNLLLALLQEDGLSKEAAAKRFYGVDRDGLVVREGKNVRPEQQIYAQDPADLKQWTLATQDEISLEDVVRNAGLTVLIGVSGQAGAFSEEIVREMAKHTERPVIFPLSNPTSHAEAVPDDLFRWTAGKALVGSGSPFAPTELNGRIYRAAQTNNSYIFPGLALGVLTSKARHVSDAMVMAAARALDEQSPTRLDKNASLLPPLGDSRKVSRLVAEAVGRQAIADGLSGVQDEASFIKELDAYIWEPQYRSYERAGD